MSNTEDRGFTATLKTPFSHLGITVSDGHLSSLEFIDDDTPEIFPSDPFTKTILSQLKAYIKDPRTSFDLPLSLKGTPFQQSVWRALQAIPSGKVLTYGELAKKLKTAPRAVGNACRANPIPVIVPCHRIVSAQGLGGYAGNIKGRFKNIKTWLLTHENVI